MTTFSLRAAKHTRPALALLGLGLLGLASCQSNIDGPPAPSAGTATFTRYIAVGNSLTAGYEDGGLYLDGQQNSYPSILAQQFAKVGGGQFRQPLFTTAQANGSGYLRLASITSGVPVTQTVTTNLAVRGTNPNGGLLYTKYPDAIENLGVPGIRLADVQTPGYGSVLGNPFFERITPDANALQTYFQRVKTEAATATFFSLWLGNNDVLGYATSGGSAQTTGTGGNTGASSPPANTITRTDSFTVKATRMVNVLTANGARGVVSSIPDVTGIPFFTTVGPALKARLAAASVPGLVIFTGGNPGAATTGNRKQIATADIRDASGTGRQLFTLTSSPFIGLIGTATGRPWRYVYAQTGLPAAGFRTYLTAFAIDTTQLFGASAGNPIPSAFVLDDVEQGLVATATTAYNTALQNLATSKGLAFFDANAFFRTIGPGIATNAVNNSASYVSGNLFSLDGVHPTPRGYALIANEIIRVINATYGATIPQVAPNDYRAIPFP